MDQPTKIPFYIWAKIPDHVKEDSVDFCMRLAKQGVITTPAEWLGSKKKTSSGLQ